MSGSQPSGIFSLCPRPPLSDLAREGQGAEGRVTSIAVFLHYSQLTVVPPTFSLQPSRHQGFFFFS